MACSIAANGPCTVEQIQEEEKVTPGEWFFTSGEDRIFPKGFPVGTVISVQPGQGMKEVKLNLSGAPGGVEEVLVVLQGVHQPIPVGAGGGGCGHKGVAATARGTRKRQQTAEDDADRGRQGRAEVSADRQGAESRVWRVGFRPSEFQREAGPRPAPVRQRRTRRLRAKDSADASPPPLKPQPVLPLRRSPAET